MPQTPHVEKHFTASETVRDIVIGRSDGLTAPFALAAGLSSAIEATGTGTGIIITAGLAEVAAGAIAMGLGGYLAARTDAEHFVSERAREEQETKEMPEKEAAEGMELERGDEPERDGVVPRSAGQAGSVVAGRRGQADTSAGWRPDYERRTPPRSAYACQAVRPTRARHPPPLIGKDRPA